MAADEDGLGLFDTRCAGKMSLHCAVFGSEITQGVLQKYIGLKSTS